MEIIFQDDDIILVNKPHGMLVHRTALDTRADTFVLQELRNIIGAYVYPVHRLDRKTSGILLLAKNKTAQSILFASFRDHQIDKEYIALVRGFTEDLFTIDYPLLSDKGKSQEATTHFTTLERKEIDISSGKYSTSRYSKVLAKPVTGRMHQIRRHLSHIFHPIIGDRPHGCNKQNKFFKEQFGYESMALHALSLGFQHPISKASLVFRVELSKEMSNIQQILGFSNFNNVT